MRTVDIKKMKEELREQPIGDILQLIREAKDHKAQLTAEINDITKVIDVYSEIALEKMDEADVSTVSTDSLTVKIKEQLVPTVRDWDKLWSFILEEKALTLLHRRVSSIAYKEYLDSGEDVPGVEPYIRRTIETRVKN